MDTCNRCVVERIVIYRRKYFYSVCLALREATLVNKGLDDASFFLSQSFGLSLTPLSTSEFKFLVRLSRKALVLSNHWNQWINLSRIPVLSSQK